MDRSALRGGPEGNVQNDVLLHLTAVVATVTAAAMAAAAVAVGVDSKKRCFRKERCTQDLCEHNTQDLCEHNTQDLCEHNTQDLCELTHIVQ